MDSLGHRAEDSAISLTVIITSLTLFFVALCCGPLCCICYAALQFLSLREKTLQERSTNFVVQWRSQNPIKPFENAKEWIGRGWEAWHFKFLGLPKVFNGLSTEIFQSPEPMISVNAHNLQEINFNPGIGSRRKPQTVQCSLPLIPCAIDEEMGECLRPSCQYFEVSIVSHRPSGEKQKISGRIQGNVAIGLASTPCPPFRMPGHDPISVAFHSKGGEIFMGETGTSYSFGNAWNRIGATVGCGYDFAQGGGRVFFTHSGGPPVVTTFAVPENVSSYLFPIIGADCDVTVIANMGQKSFHYNILPTVILTRNMMNSMGGTDRSAVAAIPEEQSCRNCSVSIDVEKEEKEASAFIPPSDELQTSDAECSADKEVQNSCNVCSVDTDMQTHFCSASNVESQEQASSSASTMVKENCTSSASAWASNMEKEEQPSSTSNMEEVVEVISASVVPANLEVMQQCP